MQTQAPKIYRVGELTHLIKNALEREFGSLWVEGEVSNLRLPASGHAYFTVKDDAAQLSAVMWRREVERLPFRLEDGLAVRVYGPLTVYERGGNYQIVVRKIEPAGRGALYAAFEKLKLKLEAEGLFAPACKKPLPRLPQHVGVVTSPTGAAIRDILNVLTRRFPNLHVVIAPARVQGEGAAEEIAAALELLNARGGIDVIIAGRGGGSLEELWPFNEERVARAIAASRIPVISAVGHEIDFTISDFVADLRAPTPSAAAELVVASKEDFEKELAGTGRRLASALRAALAEARRRLAAAGGSYVFREPGHVVGLAREKLGNLRQRARAALMHRWRETQQQIDEWSLRLQRETRAQRADWEQTLRRLAAQLRALSPLAVLERGYSLTRDEKRRILRSVAGLEPGARVFTRLAHGEFEAEVKHAHSPEKDG